MDKEIEEANKIYNYTARYSFYKLGTSDQEVYHSEINTYMNRKHIGISSFSDFVSIDGSSVKCPNNPNHRIGKNGRDRNGKQRYICKDCGKNFTATTGSLSSCTLQDIDKWITLVLCLLNNKTIEEICKECSISKNTVISWRNKVFEAIESLMSKIKLSDIITADETFVDYNLKGNHSNEFIMPRNSHSRGKQNTQKNHHKNKTCILCAIDSNGHSFSHIIGFGNASAKRVINGFSNKLIVNEKTVLITDGAEVYGKVAEYYNIKNWMKLTTKHYGKKRVPNVQGVYNIQSINSYHNELKRFLHKHRGVSSKYLTGYLLLFDFKKNNKNVDDNFMCKQIIGEMVSLSYASEAEILTKKYFHPVSNGKETETWERKVPFNEQKIYKDWYNKVPINEIKKKYKINKRKIYTVKDKVEKYGLHDKVLASDARANHIRTSKPISERDWQIYLLYNRENMTLSSIGKQYNISAPMVHKIIKYINHCPESIGIQKKKHKKKPLNKPVASQLNQQLYRDFVFLDDPGITLKETYELLARKYELSYLAVRQRLFKIRQRENVLFKNRAWKEERKILDKHSYSEYLYTRNQRILRDYFSLVADNSLKKMKIYQNIADGYCLSVFMIQKIIRFMQQERAPVQA